jgi:hypothetical protein
MPTSFRSQSSSTRQPDTTGDQRPAVVCYLSSLPLDEKDRRIKRTYDEVLNQTTFRVEGLPKNSRPISLWKQGEQAFGCKLRWEREGMVIICSLKGQIPYNPTWQIDIISPLQISE